MKNNNTEKENVEFEDLVVGLFAHKDAEQWQWLLDVVWDELSGHIFLDANDPEYIALLLKRHQENGKKRRAK